MWLEGRGYFVIVIVIYGFYDFGGLFVEICVGLVFVFWLVVVMIIFFLRGVEGRLG